MAYEERKKIFERIQNARSGRSLVCFLNFDRMSEPKLTGLSTQFHSEVKEALYRVLKDTNTNNGLDLFLYTRGGDTNSVWPIVSIIREFDPDFQVLVPFRCHSSGTLVALGAEKILMSPLSELSPIDPTTGNQFNPPDPANPSNRMGISVEDVRSYKSFILEQFQQENNVEQLGNSKINVEILAKFIEELTKTVHPLALGNVQRVLFQIQQLASNLLELHPGSKDKTQKIVENLTTKFYSHLHMINRHEAKTILGNRVRFAPKRLSNLMDNLLRTYEDNFNLRQNFYLDKFMGTESSKQVRFAGGVLESQNRSYLFETRAKVTQYSDVPKNVQIQLQSAQAMPLIPGLPKTVGIDIINQGWVNNKTPVGVTI